MEEIDGWTLKSLKALMDERDLRYTERATAQKEAVDLAYKQSEQWRENANEWREAMTDKDRNFVTKNAVWAYLTATVALTIAFVEILQKVFGR